MPYSRTLGCECSIIIFVFSIFQTSPVPRNYDQKVTARQDLRFISATPIPLLKREKRIRKMAALVSITPLGTVCFTENIIDRSKAIYFRGGSFVLCLGI